MPEIQTAMKASGANIQNAMGTTGHGRGGGPDLGAGVGASLNARELALSSHFVQPAHGVGMENLKKPVESNKENNMPHWYNQYDGLAAPYAAPSAAKDHMIMKQAIREAAGQELGKNSGVVRTDPISEQEVSYLKSMSDQAELAKFDEYVESLIDPRQPGNMQWLMSVYPDYVERRLQQAHVDHEYALRNELLDAWGINTFEDLHFKYLVDQGRLDGPHLQRQTARGNSGYTPGWLSPYNFQSKRQGEDRMYLPFSSAKVGRKPKNADDWSYNRAGRPLGEGNDYGSLARGIYQSKAEGVGTNKNWGPGKTLPYGQDGGAHLPYGGGY